jgi:hypothetical protein
MKVAVRYVIVLLLAVALVPFTDVGVAHAVVGPPTLISPSDGSTVTSNPVLRWQAVPGATSYRVQVAINPSFTGPLVNATTVNTRYAPPVDLPQTLLYWRVAATDAALGPFSDAFTFTKESAGGPTLASPASGATLHYPTDPPVFSWEPFAGAKRYEIEIDTDDSFVPPLNTGPTSTTNTSFSLVTPPSIGTTYFWRVRAFSPGNFASQYSETRSYTYDWPTRPTLTSPPNNNETGSAIEQVEFVWSAVAGAAFYDLQVSPNDQFTGALTVNGVALRGTRFSPPVTLDAGAYYWRVRTRTTNNAVGDWSDVSTFYRAWPAPDAGPNHRVTLLAPSNANFNVGVVTFAWTPVRLASLYEINMGTDQNFSPSTFSVCQTQQTTYTPINSCRPSPGIVYYWRVKPLDGPNPVNGLFSATSSFMYFPTIPTMSSPANGASLTGPVRLQWNSVANISRWKVTVLRANGTTAETALTYAREYVPQTLVPAEGPFKWFVQTVENNGIAGIIPSSGSFRSFSFTPPLSEASPPNPLTLPGTAGVHVPNLTWVPVTDATSYELWTAPFGSSVFTQLENAISVNSFTYPDDQVGVGTWSYFIRANFAAAPSVDGSVSTFVVSQMASTVLTGPAHCTDNTSCPVESVTPTFTWTWDPNATEYIFYTATDPNFTNITSTITDIHFPTYRPTTSFADAQAGQATYWYARPCYGVHCGQQPSVFAGLNPPIRAFRKKSAPVVLLSPPDVTAVADPKPSIANQITFTWQDYLATNLVADPPSELEARNYKVEISTTADMQSLVHTSALVDQTTYTLYSSTLPEGPLFWHVQAFDQQSNALTFSETWEVVKASPKVVPLTPIPNANVSGVPVFTWTPQAYAANYQVEVYKNTLQPLTNANRVLTVTTSLTGWIPTTQLATGQYGWRIRRLDADSRAGSWTTDNNDGLRLFNLNGNAVSLLTPTNGDTLGDDNQLFTWTAANGAAQYRFESSTTTDFSVLTEAVTTVQTAWASTIHYANGVYFWRVKTIDGSGNTTATSSVRGFTHGPVQPSPVNFHPVPPARILDSRPTHQVGPYGTKWATNVTRDVQVAGFSGVPAGADAVTLNVAVTGGSAPSYLTIWPKGQARPQTANLNWPAGATIANAVTMTVGASDSVSVRNNAGTVDVIVDIVGYYDDAAGDGFTPLAVPKRIQDSRPAYQVGPYSSKWGPGVTRNVTVAGGSTGVPTNADAVVLNVAVTGSSLTGYLTLYPNGQAKPTASSINFAKAQTIANAVTAKVGTLQQVKVFNAQGNVDVIIDVIGYFRAGTGEPYRPLPNPVRIQDSRPTSTVGPYTTPWATGTDRAVQVTGPAANIPIATASAAMLNVAVTGGSTAGYLTVYPNGAVRSTASSMNWAKAQTISNSVTAGIGNAGQIRAYNAAGNVHVIMDVFGYYGV